MNKLTLGSLFDGSGGFPLGGILTGITPVWASEVEPFAIRVTSKRMPFLKHYGDISAMDGSKIEPVDIITFGSPCQDMSVAGKRSGLDGSRSSLFYEAVRIIKEMRSATNGKYPRYIVWENVPGAFSSNKGQDFKAVLDSLIGIVEKDTEVPMPDKGEWAYADCYMGNGWSLAYRVFDAQFWGVPQRRRRIYLVADFRGRSAYDILFKSEGLSGYSAEGFRAWQRAANGIEESTCGAKLGFDGYNGNLTEDVSSTLGVNCGMSTGRCGVIEESSVFENHSQDTRYKGPLEVAPIVSATYGMGGNNQPFVVEKARLWNGDKVAPTLTTKNAGGNQRMPDIGNFNCVLEPFGISAKDSNAMKSKNPNSGVYKAKTSRCLDANGGNPCCNQGGIAVVCIDQGGGKSGCNVSVEQSPTLTCTHGGEPAICIQGSVIGRKDENGPLGSGLNEEKSFTLNATDRHAVFAMTTGSFTQVEEEKSPTLMARDYKDPNAVIYAIDREAYNAGKNFKRGLGVNDDGINPTLTASGPSAVAYSFDQGACRDVGALFLENTSKTLTNGSCSGYHNGVIDTDYAVRRLTPTECARLQGFPDRWCKDLGTEKPTDEEVYFWYKVFETHRKITGGDKPKTDKQIRAWLKKPYSDSAEYKLWGNGVALPCVVFVLAGIVWANDNFS